ncbi:hypothetical protein V6N12_052747 [Hibiscus sabdariffa]|uniref:Transmembrane 9 superfamily member n=1 Tax=Hibiscus sabdariffa TaxID=183260 RepID=A0ABR2C2G6_9ROSI
MLLLWVFMGLFAGYSSARLYKLFRGTEWKKVTLKTAFMFPATVFAIFFVLNALIWGQKSSGAVPFGTMFALVLLWCGISVPLVYVGSYFGFKKPAIEDPVKTSKIPRQIPEQACEDYLWWWRSYLTSGSSALYLCILCAHWYNWFLCLLLVHKAHVLISED